MVQKDTESLLLKERDPDDVPVIIDNVRSSSEQLSTSLFIKLMLIVAASGEKGPMVAILAWKDLPPGVFFSGSVLGLCNTSEVRRGQLYIAKTRAGNPALWRHFFLSILIPWIISHSTLHDKDVRLFISMVTIFSFCIAYNFLFITPFVCLRLKHSVILMGKR